MSQVCFAAVAATLALASSGCGSAAGAVLHWDGTSWSAKASSTTATINAVWGAASNDLWIVVDDGAIFNGTGVTWVPSVSGAATELAGLWGTSAADVWAVGGGGTALHRTM